MHSNNTRSLAREFSLATELRQGNTWWGLGLVSVSVLKRAKRPAALARHYSTTHSTTYSTKNQKQCSPALSARRQAPGQRTCICTCSVVLCDVVWCGVIFVDQEGAEGNEGDEEDNRRRCAVSFSYSFSTDLLFLFSVCSFHPARHAAQT